MVTVSKYGHDSQKYPKKGHDEKISGKIGPSPSKKNPGYAPEFSIQL